MAGINIFQQYGIKEVANVYFEALASDVSTGVAEGDIVLYLDTLKVSTVEQTAEKSDARGGWGNPKLITWDYGKEMTLTLEDALISMESLRLMMGGSIKESTTEKPVTVYRSAECIFAGSALGTLYDGASRREVKGEEIPTAYKWINLTSGKRGFVGMARDNNFDGDTTDSNEALGADEQLVAAIGTKGDKVRIFWTEERKGGETDAGAVQITISPSTFPGTYRVVGDTFIRDTNGTDSAFQFVIGKAKVSSDVTITLEAEGDPSTFEMQLTVLRNGSEMMSLIKY